MRVKGSVMQQLRDFQNWSSTGAVPGDVSLLDYVGFVATVDSLFGFAELFMPELLVHQGRRFLASGFSRDSFDAWVRTGRSPKEIQRTMNHVHISTLLQQHEIADEVAVEAARVLSDVWKRTLGSQGLAVEALGATFSDAAVTFYEQESDDVA